MAGVRHLRQAGCKQLCRQLGLGGWRNDPVLPAGHKQHLAGAVAQLRHQAGAGVEGIDGLPLRMTRMGGGGSGREWAAVEMSGVEGNRGGDRVGGSREWQGWAASTSGSDLQHKDCTMQQPGQRGAFHKNGEQQQLRGRVGERRQPAHLLVLHICADAQRCWACTCRDGQGGSLYLAWMISSRAAY